MNFSLASQSITFAPLLPIDILVTLAAVASIIYALFALKHGIQAIWRGVCLALFILALCNPSLSEESRKRLPDIVTIVVDESQSQRFGSRKTQASESLQSLQQKLSQHENLEVRIVHAPADTGLATETNLFRALDHELSHVPTKQRAGVIFITDGQIHDVPKVAEKLSEYGPIHALLTGDEDEKDRQLKIIQAPAYGVVGQTITVQYVVEDTQNIQSNFAPITLTQAGLEPQMFMVPTGQTQTLHLDVTHGGQNVFELSTPALQDELTANNNTVPLLVNGVRDRLRVLLVSGQPHAGGRMWRNLLTSDPSVDLVHFTILRDPSKLDATPQNELALIAFPFQELFEIKLDEFDLIVFDRYRLDGILPSRYFENIKNYVESGGALLEASGLSFANERSLYTTALHSILPGAPTGNVIRKAFYPSITSDGQKHPVTQGLNWTREKLAQSSHIWGKWLHQIALYKKEGDVLMGGADDFPLLILNRIQEGRIAQLASDHIWLWSRGFDGGGPHADLLRRTIHWLMKEPELDETAFHIDVQDQDIVVRSSNFGAISPSIQMIYPDGESRTITLTPNQDGWLESRFKTQQIGVHRFESQDRQNQFAIVGEVNPVEFRSLIATEDYIKPAVQYTRGHISRISDIGTPSVRLLNSNRNYGSRGWLGLRQNNKYKVTEIKTAPLLPPWLFALLLMSTLLWAWWKEGRS